MIFPGKNLELCQDFIFRIYHFLAEVTFKYGYNEYSFPKCSRDKCFLLPLVGNKRLHLFHET